MLNCKQRATPKNWTTVILKKWVISQNTDRVIYLEICTRLCRKDIVSIFHHNNQLLIPVTKKVLQGTVLAHTKKAKVCGYLSCTANLKRGLPTAVSFRI